MAVPAEGKWLGPVLVVTGPRACSMLATLFIQALLPAPGQSMPTVLTRKPGSLVFTAPAEMVVGGMATCAEAKPTPARPANHRNTPGKKSDLRPPTRLPTRGSLQPSENFIRMLQKRSGSGPTPSHCWQETTTTGPKANGAEHCNSGSVGNQIPRRPVLPGCLKLRARGSLERGGGSFFPQGQDEGCGGRAVAAPAGGA